MSITIDRPGFYRALFEPGREPIVYCHTTFDGCRVWWQSFAPHLITDLASLTSN